MYFRFIVILLVVVNSACKRSETSIEENLSDLNLYFRSDIKVDSVSIFNQTQDRDIHYIPFSDTMKIDFVFPVDDHYLIKFYTEKGQLITRGWLKGENVIIKGSIDEKVQIDTVIGSDRYYAYNSFFKEYLNLYESGDKEEINSFLMEEFNKHYDDKYSIEMSFLYYVNNRDIKDELAKIYPLLQDQKKEIREELNNPIGPISKFLELQRIDFSDYTFYDLNEELVKLSPPENKTYIVDMWFIGCAPCIAEHKIIAKNLSLFHENNVEIIGVSIDQEQTDWKEFVEEKKYEWQNVRESYTSEKLLKGDLGVWVYPSYFLVDGKGNILERKNSINDFLKNMAP